MKTLADYEAWKSRQQQTGVGAAKIMLGQEFDQPDAVAKDMQLGTAFAQATGKPTPPLSMVKQYRPVFERQVEQAKATTVLSSSPLLAEWLRKPENAGVARDDLDNLGSFERLSAFAAQGNATAITQGQAFTRDVGQVLERGPVGQFVDGISDAFDKGVLMNPDGTPNWLGLLANFVRGPDGQQVGGPNLTADQKADAIANGPLSPIYQGAQKLLTEMEASGLEPLKWQDIRGAGTLTTFIAENIAMSLPQMLAAVGSGGFGPIIGLVGLSGEANDELKKRTDLPIEQRVAVATSAGVVMTALDIFGMGKIFGGLPVGGMAAEAVEGVLADRLVTNGVASIAAKALEAAVAEGSTELLQEAIVMTVTGASGGKYKPEEIAGRLIESFLGGAAAGGAMRGGFEIAGAGAQRMAKDPTKAAEQTAETLKTISETAQASKLRERAPEKFMDYLKRAFADTSVENVFVPGTAWATYFQSQGLDPFDVVDALDGVTREDLETAIQTGGDIKIPTASYATTMAGSPHEAFMMENARLNPDDMTAVEAEEFNEKAQEALQEAYDLAEAVRRDEETYAAVETQIYDEMVGRLRTAGRSTDVATTEALLYPAFYRTMAERSGMAIEDFLAKHPLPQVRGAAPAGMQLRDADALTRTLSEARARRTAGLGKGQSLLEFISERGGILDPGGELKARDASVVKRGKGRKTLRLERKGVAAAVGDMLGGRSAGGHGFDDVARAAIEAGFMASDPVVLAYQQAQRDGTEVPDIGKALLEAIDRELRGETVAAAPVDGLDQIEEYLAGLGVSLDDDDAAIRAAMEQGERRYGQPAVSTETEAFKRWFGDSKVVDAQGKPLVVYHGTASEFDAFDPAESGQNFASDKGKFFFTGSEAEAERYADGGPVMPVYLSIKKPLIVETGAQAAEEWDERGGLLDDEIASGDYDGVIIYGSTGPMFIAFSPTQIKSVYNRGTFDPTDPRILYQPAYHGTPHLFDKFSTDHIGTGEGAQAFGWGLYFASSKAVSQWYRDELAGKSMTFKKDNETIGRNEFEQRLSVAARVAAKGWDMPLADANLQAVTIASSIAEALKDGDSLADMAVFARKSDWLPSVKDMWQASLAEAQSWEAKKPGRLFEVEVPDDGDLLDWNAPLSDQPPAVLAKLRAAIESAPWRDDILADMDVSSVDELIVALEDEGMSGENSFGFIYNGLSDITGSDEALSKALREAGIPGHRYLDGNSRRAGDGSYNYVIYDDTRVSVRSYEQADMMAPGGGSRGSISFQNGEAVISLFASADLSTVIHETGHYFLASMQDLARDGGPIAAEYQAVKDWWQSHADAVATDAARVAGLAVTADDVRLALDGGTTGNPVLDNAIDIGMQEQFARAFETYLMEGKAPSLTLRAAFEKFRAWLLSIYRKARGLNVEVSPELRTVFDRMLATDAEILAAQRETAPDVQVTADDLGMTAEQFAAFTRLRTQAKDEAAAKLLAETMAPIKRAATEAYKNERKTVRAITEKRLRDMPMFRAVQELRFGRDFDGADVPAVKLDRAIIERDYGAGWLPQLPGSTSAGKGHKNAVFAHEGGLHPDIVAGMYGYQTGGQLLDALAKAPAIEEAIDAETDRIMRERHSDPLTDGSVQQLALDAVHGDKRGEALAAELRALNEVAGLDRGLTVKEARETARRTLRTMRVRDASAAHRFLAAERKAGQEAMRLTATVTREGMWMDRARRLVETKARAAVRSGDAEAAAGITTDAANATTGRFNEDAAALVEAKRRQLMNHMLYAEARKVAAETEAVVDRLARLNKPDAKLGKSRNVDFVKAARAVAARFGLAAGDKQFEFSTWIEQLRFDDPVTAADLQYSIDVNSQEARNFKDLTVAEFETTADAIENILAVGKRSREMEIDGQRVERDLAISELRDVLDQRTPVANKALSRKLTRFEKVRVGTLSVLASLRRMEAWTRDMDDGGQGAFTRYLTKPVMDALGVYRNDRANRLGQLLAILEPRRADLVGAAFAAPELGPDVVFNNKGELLHAILHTGNESNLEKLLLGRGWSKGLAGQVQKVTKSGKPSVGRQGNPLMTRGRVDTSQWDAFVARLISEGVLVKEDFDTAQAIWDLMDEIKRPAQAAHRRVFGFYFKEVEANPVVTPFGTYRGGYVPAIADTDASNDGQIRADQAALEAQQTSFMFPTTGSGFTKSRVQNYTTPLSLNLMLLPAHMDKVLRFTHLNPVIRQTASLVTKGELREAIDAVDPSIIPNLITPWLQRTAQQAVEAMPTTPAGRAGSAVWRELRKRVGLSTMFLNVVNTVQQVTGLSSALVLVKPGRMVTAMTRFARDAGGMRNEAIEASAFMRDRITNAGREMQGRIQDAIVKPTKLEELKGLADRHGYFLQQGAQNLVDVVAWHAAYDQAIAGGMDGDAAVFEADSVIRRAMGDFSAENVSMFETGDGFKRLFTMFYSYFNGQANLIGGEMATAMRRTGWGGKGRMFFIYLYGLAIPAIVGEAISQAARGELGDEDDDGWLDDLGELFFGSQARYVSGMVPVVGPLVTGILNSFNDKFYDDRVSISPVAQGAETLVRSIRSVAGGLMGDDLDKAAKDGLTALGLVLGIPLGQLGKMAGYGVNVAEGDARPENVVDVAEGLLTGRDGTE